MKNMQVWCAVALSLLAVSCTSLQDVYVNIDELEKSEDIQRIEKSLAFLDGDFMAHGNDASFNKSDFVTNCTAVAKDAETALKVPELQKIPQARLLALQGRAYQLAGNNGRAKNLSAQSAALYAGDTQNVILASRLGQNANLDTKDGNASEIALLTLEKALQSFAAGDYAAAVAGFDTAFLSLDAYYQEAYGAAREKAWDLRTVSGEDASVLLKDSVTVGQMLTLTQDTTNVLFNYTSGKTLSANELYKRLSAAGVLSPVTKPLADAKQLPAVKSVVTRYLAARYLWNLYTNAKASLATRYSAQFAAAGSPLADVPLENPDFDAVLGCVENEFLSLPDGEHFEGEKNISAVELRAGLGKIK